jgi:tRNA (mo5U34)-methyltransferase
MDYHGAPVNLDQLIATADAQAARLATARAQIGDAFPWYPYSILGNLPHLDRLLKGENRELDRFTQDLPVADIGAADGDLAFTLETVTDWDIDIVDTAATNMNGLRGARALRDHLSSTVKIHDIDLDRQFSLPRDRYGLVFFLGILYHLQNPYYVLRELAERSSYCLLSTKVARFAGPESTPIENIPVGYLVAPRETNNDPTNYWIFSPTGLLRLVERAGWEVLEQANVGATGNSDPSTPDRDERMFLLLHNATGA